MQLAEASAALGENNRDFSDVYKHYEFRDNQLLKEYLEFISHEPAAWFKSLPAKYSGKSITKPKTALFKLLKHPQVVSGLGAAYTKNIHDVVLSAYKKRDHASTPIENMLISSAMESASVTSESGPALVIEESLVDDDAVSIHSVKKPRRADRSELLETVLMQVLSHHKENPLYETVLTLLKAASV